MKNRAHWLPAAAFLLLLLRPMMAQDNAEAMGGLPETDPKTIGLDPAHLGCIDQAVQAAIEKREIPGAVVLVARHGRIGYLKAFGNRSIRPDVEAMTTDTVFDMASLTKVMATTPAVMLLVERGAVRLGDRVRHYLPQFTGGGKETITLRQLLTHFSGLKPDFDLSRPWRGYEAAMQQLWRETTDRQPGKEFVYSDLNFIALGEIVHVVSGQTLDVFTREQIFAPLGMLDTCFNPPPDRRLRIAPTEPRNRTLAYLKGEGTSAPSQEILRGEVHDPTAWRMGGVAGHAGLFSSARDVAVYAQMLLSGGLYQQTRILMPLTVQAMTSPQSPKDSTDIRGFGWDIDTSYSAPRGDLFGEGFGHTGFTGTSLWVSPATDSFVVILSNRVHPDGRGDATRLRAVIADIVAGSIRDPGGK
jgi:CubicO group peptidase (beta-lactamase class C family)